MTPNSPGDWNSYVPLPGVLPGAMTERNTVCLLQALLPLAVARCLEVVRQEDWDTRKLRLDRLAEKNPEWGGYTFLSEAILVKIPGKTREAFSDLAMALAIMSFAPGGVRFLGMHWEEKEDTHDPA